MRGNYDSIAIFLYRVLSLFQAKRLGYLFDGGYYEWMTIDGIGLAPVFRKQR